MTPNPRLRTVLVTNNTLSSLLALSALLREFGEQIVAVCITTKLPGESNNVVGTLRMLRQSGLRYTGYKIFMNLVVPPLAKLAGYPTSPVEFLRRRGLTPPVISCATINEPDIQRQIAAFEPSLLLGAGATHVFSSSTLALPSTAAINLHPSVLPHYAGISPYFWALANGDAVGGATLHQMVAKLDAGPIIAQLTTPLADVKSVFELNDWIWDANHQMLTEFYRSGASLDRVVPQDLSQRSYVKHPTLEDVRRLRRQGRGFFRLRDVGRLLRRLRRIDAPAPSTLARPTTRVVPAS